MSVRFSKLPFFDSGSQDIFTFQKENKKPKKNKKTLVLLIKLTMALKYPIEIFLIFRRVCVCVCVHPQIKQVNGFFWNKFYYQEIQI